MSAKINLYQSDWRDFLPGVPDKYYDLACVDPPYFTGPERRRFYGNQFSTTNIKRAKYVVIDRWEIPDETYFKELFRVSKQQIIWGCNYYDFVFPSGGRIVWDKVNGKSSYSDCEIAYCSFHDSVRLFRYMWNGMQQGKSITEGHIMQSDKNKNEKRIHQTQKPVILYDWLLQTYAKPGQRVLDTHGGSMSIAISCDKAGIDLDLTEKDSLVYQRGQRRFNQYKAQHTMFPIVADSIQYAAQLPSKTLKF
jgi:site-specific DNA-methyltransferase (adenine-specific)